MAWCLSFIAIPLSVLLYHSSGERKSWEFIVNLIPVCYNKFNQSAANQKEGALYLLHIKQAVVVEGRYDKIALSAVLDAPILTTEGFRIFSDKEKAATLSHLAKTRGLVVITDSDSAGFRIRNYIKSVTRDENVLHIYIPQILGKERRKSTSSKEGLLGVEGFSPRQLEELLRKQGLTDSQEASRTQPFSSAQFYALGLSGKEGSAQKRQKVLAHFGLPSYLSAKAMRAILHCYTDYPGLAALCETL